MFKTLRSLSTVAKAASISLLGIGLFAVAPVAHAQTFPTYSTPVFNTFATGSPYGDERDFLQIAPNGSSAFTNDFTACSDGAVATVAVYIHNNAAEGFNGENNTGSGVATGLKLALPSLYGTTSSNFTITGKITASNAPTASDVATIHCADGDYTLNYQAGSAKLYAGTQNGVTLPDAVFTADGTLIGHDALNGVWPGCWNFVGSVQAKVVLTKKPATVVSKSCDALSITKSIVKPNEAVTVTATASAQNIAILGYTFVVKNQAGAVVATKDVATSATTASYIFSQSTTGKYTVSAIVKFADGEVTSPNCVKNITVALTPTKIVDTGAGSMFGALTALTIVGAIMHRAWTIRRSSL